MAIDLDKIINSEQQQQYPKYIEFLQKKYQSECKEITDTVDETIENILNKKSKSFVIYGEPQSGKTELMICLVKKLRDLGKKHIVIVMNDNVKLKDQNLSRFREAGIDPAPKDQHELQIQPIDVNKNAFVVICKKNKNDLERLINTIGNLKDLILLDDEADYATPNSKINKKQDEIKTKINELITKITNFDGVWIGVTATPARLDLNNTMLNDHQQWVPFRAHNNYTGRNFFFPRKIKGKIPIEYNLMRLPDSQVTAKTLRTALFTYMVTVADINLQQIKENREEKNYSMIVHTSGKMDEHEKDLKDVETVFKSFREKSQKYEQYLNEIKEISVKSFSEDYATAILKYIWSNKEKYLSVVMNSHKDIRSSNSDAGLNPATTFTIIFGGDIISRGLTFKNLLAMYFARDTKSRITIDTYIQRARMFGDRNDIANKFNLTIPENLYADWWTAFDNHHKGLISITKDDRPFWFEDSRTRVTAPASIDKANVDTASGEFSFKIFTLNKEILDIYFERNVNSFEKIKKLFNFFKNDDFKAKVFLEDTIDNAYDKKGNINPSMIHFQNLRNIRRQKLSEEEIKNIRRNRGGLVDPVSSDEVVYLYALYANLPNGMKPSEEKEKEIYNLIKNEKISARLFYKSTHNKKYMRNYIEK